jgi:hypothetical protein
LRSFLSHGYDKNSKFGCKVTFLLRIYTHLHTFFVPFNGKKTTQMASAHRLCAKDLAGEYGRQAASRLTRKSKTRQNAAQKAAFHNIKGGISQCETPPFAIPQPTSWLSACWPHRPRLTPATAFAVAKRRRRTPYNLFT